MDTAQADIVCSASPASTSAKQTAALWPYTAIDGLPSLYASRVHRGIIARRRCIGHVVSGVRVLHIGRAVGPGFLHLDIWRIRAVGRVRVVRLRGHVPRRMRRRAVPVFLRFEIGADLVRPNLRLRRATPTAAMTAAMMIIVRVFLVVLGGVILGSPRARPAEAGRRLRDGCRVLLRRV